MAYVIESLGAAPAGGSALQQAATTSKGGTGWNRSSTGNPQDYERQLSTIMPRPLSKGEPVPPAPPPGFAPAPDFNQVAAQSPAAQAAGQAAARAAEQPATTSTVGAPVTPTTTQQAMPPWKIAAIGGGVLVGALLLGRLVKGR